MAKRGSNKARSVEQENWVAEMYGGRRSPSSGASDTDQGDVRTRHELIECKMSGGPGDTPKGGRLHKDFAKIADEAFAEGREPALCLRFWNPDSILADRAGYVNLTVRLTTDDVERSFRIGRTLEALRIADDILFGEGLGDGRIDRILKDHGITDARQRFDWKPERYYGT